VRGETDGTGSNDRRIGRSGRSHPIGGSAAAIPPWRNPGEIVTVSGAQATLRQSRRRRGLLLVLCDPDPPVWLATSHDSAVSLRRWIAFHTGAPLIEARGAVRVALGWGTVTCLVQVIPGRPHSS